MCLEKGVGKGVKSSFTGRERKPFLAVSMRYFVVVFGFVWSGGPGGNVAKVFLPRFNHSRPVVSPFTV